MFIFQEFSLKSPKLKIIMIIMTLIRDHVEKIEEKMTTSPSLRKYQWGGDIQREHTLKSSAQHFQKVGTISADLSFGEVIEPF